MSRSLIVALAAAWLVASAPPVDAQTARKPARKPVRKPAPVAGPVTAAADLTCPQVLGTGVGSRLQFCDVMTARTPADGIIIRLPPHKGVLTLTFDLHNRHMYSEQQVKAGKAYASYTTTVAAVAPDSTVLGRGIAQHDFRTSRDLLDRIGGGAGPRGVKAVAPVGTERIRIEVPQDVSEVSLLGEKLTVVRFEGTEIFTFAGPSRPVALISNVKIQYLPGPKPAAKPAAKK